MISHPPAVDSPPTREPTFGRQFDSKKKKIDFPLHSYFSILSCFALSLPEAFCCHRSVPFRYTKPFLSDRELCRSVSYCDYRPIRPSVNHRSVRRSGRPFVNCSVSRFGIVFLHWHSIGPSFVYARVSLPTAVASAASDSLFLRSFPGIAVSSPA